MDPLYLKIALGGLALMASIGLFFGIGLALAAHKFAVEINPKVEAIMDILPGANCGACGYPGCEAYAEAVINESKVKANLCTPGQLPVAEEVAIISGKEVEKIEGAVAVVHCARCERDNFQKYDYTGYDDCAGAILAFAGPTDCQHGCVGFGDCVRACPFDAIEMVDNYPVIDPDACLACGLCLKACPKELISLVPKKARIIVRCWSKDTAKETQSLCSMGCLHCEACVRDCPAQAVALKNNVIQIDHEKCLEYGDDCNTACLNACWINYPAFSRMGEMLYEDGNQCFQRPICKNTFQEIVCPSKEKQAKQIEEARNF